ncbi:MAG: hypothetical protein PHC39_09410 [Proteiniphilum sp.]|nr:hypothetical protein [Proteiniphilum sp.]MDD3908792.1 hypothetical protein [Proteiniphilum sp.]
MFYHTKTTHFASINIIDYQYAFMIILDIAIETGFNDVRNAYRIFKNKTGYTPMNFKEKFSQKTDTKR